MLWPNAELPQTKEALVAELERLGVETDITKRWTEGTPHHPMSQEVALTLGTLDLHLCSDYFCWKFGGDGDNGETLMYLLDLYFEAVDAQLANRPNVLVQDLSLTAWYNHDQAQKALNAYSDTHRIRKVVDLGDKVRVIWERQEG